MTRSSQQKKRNIILPFSVSSKHNFLFFIFYNNPTKLPFAFIPSPVKKNSFFLLRMEAMSKGRSGEEMVSVQFCSQHDLPIFTFIYSVGVD